MTTALVDLTSYRGSWRSAYALGYYLHQGRVYLDAVLYNNAGDALTQTLLTGMPAEARPSAPVHLTIPVNLAGTTPTADAALQLPASYAATVGTDGSLTLDAAVPDQLINTPDATTYFYVDRDGIHYARYPHAFVTSLILSNLSWPVLSESDTFSTSSLSASLSGSDFANVDSAYDIHTERVHLAGHVTASINAATELLASLPSGTTAGLSASENAIPVKRGSDTFLGTIDRTFGGSINLSTTLMKPAGQPGPLAWSAPGFQSLATTFVFRLPSGNNIRVGQNFTSVLSTGVPDDTPGTGPGHGPGVDAANGSVDYGTYTCTTDLCRTPGPLPAVVLRLASILATIDPAPDWFMLEFEYAVNITQHANDGTCVGSSCGPILSPDFGFDLATSDGLLVASDGVTSLSISGSDGGAQGFIAPTSPLYTGSTFLTADALTEFPNAAPGAIWQWGQLTTDITLTPSGQVSSADWGAFIRVVPLYEAPMHGIRAGDSIDLSGTGWVGTLSTFVAGPRVYLPSLAYFGIVMPRRDGTIVDHADGTTPITVFPTETAASGDDSGTFTTNPLGQVPGWIDRQSTDLYVDITIDPNPTVTILIPKL